jgi:5-methylcytosine-specific restriction endonuclease McrA
MGRKDYSQQKKCPICGARITNRSSYCRKHLAYTRGQQPRKGNVSHYSLKKKCVDCRTLISDRATRCDKCLGIYRRTIYYGRYQFNKGRRCLDCGKEVSNKALRCRSCSRKLVPRPDMMGDRNWRWNGGYKDYYGPNWESQRKAALMRDKNKCVLCDGADRQLNVHHQIPFVKCPSYVEANDLSNLVTLCQQCHRPLERGNMDYFNMFLK